MYTLRIGDRGNRLYVGYEDLFDAQAAEQFYKELQEIAPKLKNGFVVLVDLCSLEQMELNARVYIEKAMDLLNKNGVSKIIRVIPDENKDIGLNIMSAFHYSSKVAIHTYRSYEEAEQHLAGERKPWK